MSAGPFTMTADTQAMWHRREALTGVLSLLACPVLPALAEPKYEQMEGLKGKDYGKVRTK